MRTTYYLKPIFGIFLLIFITASLSTCNNPPPASTPENTTPAEFIEETEEPEASLPELGEPPKETSNVLPENRRQNISGFPVEEQGFIENLDIAVLEMIAGEIQSLVAEIQEKEKADSQYVLEARWYQDFQASEQYKVVLELGLRAVKPAYYIIYKSPQSGLYEYILASAIDEITGYNYSVTENYGWSNSKQFLTMYNEKVSKTLTSFREILDNPDLNEGEKSDRIRALGVFAVAPLLNAIDTPSSDMSAESLEICLWDIIEDYSSEDVDHDLDIWRSENEQIYWNIIEILE